LAGIHVAAFVVGKALQADVVEGKEFWVFHVADVEESLVEYDQPFL